jgi:oxygen-independent coproporphyrinogen-3 oxidase
MIKEIELTTNFVNSNPSIIQTVYFGGGTPSILNEADLQKIFAALYTKFNVDPAAEITLEANPDDINAGSLRQWKAMGINRLSVGIQTFSEEELKWMNRAHTAAEAIHCIDEIKNAGFNNFSIDLIYGSPLLDNESWKRNVDIAIENNIPHISSYALTVEPKTPLDKLIANKVKAPVSSDRQAEQFLLLMSWMEAAGYEHYEISNFGLPGMQSKHNSSYWQGKQYYAFGPSAHSFDGKKRRWNIANNAAYIRSLQNNEIPFEEELLTITQQLNEYIMTSLRTMEGINLEYVATLFGEAAADTLLKTASKWIASEKVYQHNNALILTKEGKLFADGIAADLFFEE